MRTTSQKAWRLKVPSFTLLTFGENDLKGLTNTLVQIAASSSSSSVEFQQPLEKMLLGATFAARWAPIYGKAQSFRDWCCKL